MDRRPLRSQFQRGRVAHSRSRKPCQKLVPKVSQRRRPTPLTRGLHRRISTCPARVPDEARQRAQAIAPVVWLLGKTGAGKTAIVAALTGDPYAEVGEGFEPCTRTAAYYDVPSEAPLLRFLDTRGLGEVDYDPTKDIAWCEGQSHLLLVVMQVADPVQDKVVRVLGQARRRHPDWPIVVAQTGLHRLYPAGAKHPEPYPYNGAPDDETHATLPHALRQAL